MHCTNDTSSIPVLEPTDCAARFSPDRGFARIATAQKKATIHTLQEWVDVINDASHESHDYALAGKIMPDECFMNFKPIADQFKKLDGIKKLPISEVTFRRGQDKDGNPLVRCSYKRGMMPRVTRFQILKRGVSWASIEKVDFDELQCIPRQPLSWRRYSDLLKTAREVIPPDKFAFWENLCHAPARRGVGDAATPTTAVGGAGGSTPSTTAAAALQELEGPAWTPAPDSPTPMDVSTHPAPADQPPAPADRRDSAGSRAEHLAALCANISQEKGRVSLSRQYSIIEKMDLPRTRKRSRKK